MKYKKIILSFLCLSVLFSSFTYAEDAVEEKSDEFFFHSLSDENDTEKHYLVGISGMLVANGVIHAWDRFGSRSGWAQVYWDDIKDPLGREIRYDTDWYWTNFILHPYQGGLYYMAARNANLNFAESLAVTACGSLVWEFLCETNDPSINDMWYSGFAGAIFGEMFHRLGLEAQGRNHKVLSIVANPMRIYSDPILGHAPNGPTGLLKEMSFKAGIGTAASKTWIGDPDYNDMTEFFPGFAMAEFYFMYNDPYTHDSNIPYSQFEVEAGGAFGLGSGEGRTSMDEKTCYDVHLFSDGMLFARSGDFGDNVDTSLGLVMNFDFVWNTFMEFSTVAPGVAIKQRFNNDWGIFAWQSHLCGIIMGTSDYFYFRRGLEVPFGKHGISTTRDYGYNFGCEAVEKFNWKLNNGIIFDWKIHGYAVYKCAYQEQYNDDYGWELFFFFFLSAEYKVGKNVSLGLADELYMKTTSYRSKEDIVSLYNNISFYTRINLL